MAIVPWLANMAIVLRAKEIIGREPGLDDLKQRQGYGSATNIAARIRRVKDATTVMSPFKAMSRALSAASMHAP
jgi:hypothetical protein